ncbi:T-box transcription factor TBX21-like [Macrotis lagotis]|uniref:T-box transcription factor TBX21-like n=1 Tax=Macrotis lagotis TaxID=92651 RepID=UPI003D682338
MAPTKFRPAQDSKGVGSKLDLNHLQSSQFLARPKANIPCEDSDTCIAISGKLKVVLCNYSLWLMFYSEQTEMILNKQGRRMFPFLAYKIHGMNPAAHYRVFLEIVPVDQQHWRYQNGKWCQCEEKENNVPGNRLYIHPDSPNTGAYWMKKEISFKKLKITNNMKAINNGNKMILLQSLRKYQPRLGIEEVRDGEHETPDSSSFIHNFTFPETEFITVTAYQNTKVSQLKINFNPFARGFRESYYPEENVNNFLASRDSTAMTTTSLETDSGGYPQELGERSYQAKEGAPLNPRLLTQATQLLLGGVYDSTPSRSSSLLSLDMNGMEHGLPLFTSPSTVYHHPRQDPVVPQGNWCLASSSNSTENSGGWLQSVPPVPMDTVTRAEKEKHLEEKFWTHTLSSESNDSRLNKGGLKRSLSPDDLEDEMCPKWKCRKQSDR